MATFLSNRDGGKTNEEGHYRFQIKSFTGNVNNGLLVKQNNPLSMSVLVEAGDAKIAFQTYGYTWWNDGDLSVSLATADVSNPRIDRIVAYVDRSVTPSSSVTNNPNIVKIISVSGSPASSPVAPIDSVVQTAVGAGNPFMSLAEVRVNAGVSTISSGNITDKRIFSSPVIADGAITAGKIDFNTFGRAIVTFSATGTGITTISGVGFKPNKVTTVFGQTVANLVLGSSGFAVNKNGSIQQAVTSSTAYHPGASSEANTRTSMSHFLGIVQTTPGGGWWTAGTLTSFNADGITINITNYNATYKTFIIILEA